MATAQHYVWAGGHFILLFCAVKYLFAWLTFRSAAHPKLYSFSYFGALISYAIVCYKSFVQGPQPAGGMARRAMTDENVQYFLLALFWWMSKPVPLSLIPFATFSLFHALTFLRSNVLPQFFPPSPPAAAGQPPVQHPYLKKVQAWIKANYDPAMRLVAYAELVIFLRVLLGALTFQNSLLAPIIFAHFLRMRYYQSQFTQRAVAHVNAVVTEFVRRPGNPPVLAGVWEKLQYALSRWVGTAIQPQPAPAAGAN